MKNLCFSGIQPTNNIHLGNYIGALKQWVELQQSYNALYCIVDMHAITVPQDPKALRTAIRTMAAAYLAAGVDPKKARIFVQSEVPEHAELGWILSTIVKMAELELMTQYKDKKKRFGEKNYTKNSKIVYSNDHKHKVEKIVEKVMQHQTEKSVGVGLFTYPALMAADILLYDTVIVPVGEDQTQHLELTRTLARRFNNQFGKTFTVPEALVQKTGARIMALDDATSKMSKSATSAKSYITLADSDDIIRKKIMSAVTDSGSEIVYDPKKKPAVANLLTIFHHMTGTKIADLEKQFTGKGYGDFKRALADAVIAHLSPIRTRMQDYLNDKGELDRILDDGRDAARDLAVKKMRLVRQKVGLGR